MTRSRMTALKAARIASQALFFGSCLYNFLRSLDPFAVARNPFLRWDPLIFLTNPRLDPLLLIPPAALLVRAATLAGGLALGGAAAALLRPARTKLLRPPGVTALEAAREPLHAESLLREERLRIQLPGLPARVPEPGDPPSDPCAETSGADRAGGDRPEDVRGLQG